MSSNNLLRSKGRVTVIAALALASQLIVLLPAEAAGPQCQRRFIASNIQDAVLALKATEYCTNQNLPYSRSDVMERIESLRCGPDSVALIEDLIDDYDDKYKLIMTTDPSKAVCIHAAQLDLNKTGKK